MRPTFNVTRPQSPFLKGLLQRFIFAVCIALCIGHTAFSQFTIPYPQTIINAELVNQAEVSPCRLPYFISDKAPAAGETVQWKVVKGTAELQNSNQAFMQVQDMKEDTCILTYTIYKPGNDSIVDSLMLLKRDFLACDIIDFPWTPVTCGSTITLKSKLGEGYTYLWTSGSPNVVLINQFSADAQATFSAAGSYTLNVLARSKKGYNSIMRTYTFTVTCPGIITPADAGPDVVTLSMCQFPYVLQGNAPKAGETVKWEVVAGIARLDNFNTPNARILDASAGTQLKYTITNGTLISSDLITVTLNNNLSFCNPVVSKTNVQCGENFTINSPWFTSMPNPHKFSYTHHASVLGLGTQTTSNETFRINQAGTYSIGVQITSPFAYSTTVKTVTVTVTCPTPVTQANAGSDVTIDMCAFPFQLVGNTAAAGETVKWEVISGQAMIDNVNTPFVRILDAKAGAQLKYTITKGTQSTSDIMVIQQINTFVPALCNPLVSNLNPKCGDLVTINFPMSAPLPPANNYSYMYSVSAGLSPIGFTTGNTATFKVLQAGAHVVNILISSPFKFNTATKTVLLNATCPSTVTKANAGADANAYCQSFNLHGNSPGAGETGTWHVLEGNVTLSNEHDPNTSLAIHESGTLRFSWIIANASAFSVDTVVITANLLNANILAVIPAVCGQHNGSATVSASGGLAPYQYEWTGGATGQQLTNAAAGFYEVTVRDQSGCTVHDSTTIKDSCVVNELYTLEGDVKAGTSLLAFGKVMLFQNINDLPVLVKSVTVINGHYKFTGVEEGDYLIYVIPYKEEGLINMHDFYLPTFYVNKTSIFFANPVYVIGNTFGVDIRLAEKKTKTMGAANLAVKAVGQHLEPALPVLLFNDQEELVAAVSSVNEALAFTNLATGNYYLSLPTVERGYENTSAFRVSAGENTKDIAVITATQDVTGINSVQVFPNPFSESLTIDLPGGSEEMTLKLLDGVTGQEKKTMELSTVKGQYQVNTEELPAGFYILQLSSGEAQKTLPVIKY